MKPTAILSADWHVRDDVPKCRKDNYENVMFNKLIFIADLAKKYNCPILVAGDLFDKPKIDEWIVNQFIGIFERAEIISIVGQHDLINHRFDSLNKTTTGLLNKDKTITIPQTTWSPVGFPLIDCFHYGEKIKPSEFNSEIAMSHQMVIKRKPLWPGQKAPKAISLLKKYPQYKLILTGDNHKPFVEEYEGRVLVNPGSMMRTRADQINHKPRVYLWYEKTNKIKPIFLPIEKDVFDISYLENKEERDERIEAFVNSMNDDYDIDLSFEGNIEKYLNANRTRKSIKEKIMEAME